ncbi:MAG: DUF402 domain-containing protein [Planctomycetota bacterium]
MLVDTTKYDRSLHYRFETDVVYRDDALLALHLKPGTPMESYRGPRASEQHILMVQWAGRPWKLSVHWKPDWTPRLHYVDVIDGLDWSDGVLRLVDMDLDLVLRPQFAGPILDDVDEFEDHRERFGYPAELVGRCRDTVFEVAAKMARREPPFHGGLHDWRPGADLFPLLEGSATAGL